MPTGNAPPLAASSPAASHSAVLHRDGSDFVYSFHAMASPCEMRMHADDAKSAEEAGRLVAAEAHRIEEKFSRYRPESVVGRINNSSGAEISVDAETAHLLDFAAQCFAMSGGRFDITSGVLRRIWRFDGSANVPSLKDVKRVLPLVGWQKVDWRSPSLRLPAGMEIDLGGIGKEYAVDRALALAHAAVGAPVLVNFGGDLCVSGTRRGGTPWKVAIESVERSGSMAGLIELSSGAIATSGDARRFLLKNGVRYPHILNPRTGRPVMGAPRSVTVAAANCVEAGMLATFAMLRGRGAETFLRREKVRAWCIR